MSTDGRAVEHTYNFPAVEIVLALSTIAFEAWTHIHAGTNHGDRLVKPLWYERVVHLAFRNGPLAFNLASFHELPRRKLSYV